MVSEEQIKTLSDVEKEIDGCVDAIGKKLGEDAACFLLAGDLLQSSVDSVYGRLQDRFSFSPPGIELVVILESSGGDIDAAYNLAHLLRKYGDKGLRFIIPRWAKSAATLLACSGKEILMTPVAELGPLDPQITTTDPFEGRSEHFSPLHIESTLELIRNEYHNGHKELADGLMQRLQYPLTLGSFKKSLELSKQYMEKLLTSGMLKDKPLEAAKVAERLTEGYAAHGFCINIEESRSIGLVVDEIPESYLPEVWNMRKLLREKRRLEEERRREEMQERISSLPAELLDKLLDELTQGSGKLPN